MRRLVVLFAASAAFAAAGSAANAAECLNGFRTLPNQVILTCDDPNPMMTEDAATSGFEAETAAAEPALPGTEPIAPPEEPLYTGSIATEPVAPAAEVSTSVVVDSPAACEPGKYWVMTNPNGDALMPCR